MSAVPRLLFVHAHPDDETINNGVTMARYAALGAEVTFIEPLIRNSPFVAQLAGRRDEGMRIIDSDDLVTEGGKFKTRAADGAS